MRDFAERQDLPPDVDVAPEEWEDAGHHGSESVDVAPEINSAHLIGLRSGIVLALLMTLFSLFFRYNRWLPFLASRAPFAGIPELKEDVIIMEKVLLVLAIAFPSVFLFAQTTGSPSRT
jgi:glucose-6-phosphate-specific signal transduction histidine kinase